jgi:class 3 adenylate cyclase
MALFGAPVTQADHALRAVRVGWQMQTVHQHLIEVWRERGVDVPGIGVGIATGELIVGEMGSAQRSDYTVIGRAANLGSRICSHAAAGQILICPSTYEMVQEQVEASPVMGVRMKGIGENMTVYVVQGMKEE